MELNDGLLRFALRLRLSAQRTWRLKDATDEHDLGKAIQDSHLPRVPDFG